MRRLPWIVALALLAAGLAAQEPEAPADDGAPAAEAQDGVEAAAGDAAPEQDSDDAADEPDAEALAEAAAAAGGQIGEVDEEFTPEDEISEDYPVPLPADI